jgi:hypothetical protein
MTTFLLLALAFIAGGIIAYLVTRPPKRPDASRALTTDFRGPSNQLTTTNQRPLADLRLNDIVVYYDNDFMVEGRIAYNQGGWQWFSFMLQDGDKKLWLGVEEDDGLSLSMWKEVSGMMLDSPPPKVIEYDGETFEMEERGQASAQSIGRTGRPVDSPVTFYDYESPSGRYLSVEDWGGDIEVSIGSDITEQELTVFPGDEVAV